MRYKYFISYNFRKGGNNGFGNCQTSTINEISSMKEIQQISRSIERDFNYDQVVINNFILLGTEE